MPERYRNTGNIRPNMRRSLRSLSPSDLPAGDLPVGGRVTPSGCSPTECSSDHTTCARLLQRLQMLDFSLTDTILYLDAYPDSQEALAHYHSLLTERETIHRALATQCQMPITAWENESTDSWNWIRYPWPWEFRANE